MRWLWSQCRGIRPHLKLFWGTWSSFLLLRGPQGPSRLVTVFSVILWSYIKEVKSPSVFDGEHRLALHAMKWNWTSSDDDGEVSCFFLSWGGNLGYVLELRWGWPFQTCVGSATSGRLSSCTDTSAFSSRLGREIGTPLDVPSRETQGPFPVATGILGFLSIFKRRQALFPFEALNSACLSRCQSVVRPPVEMSRRTRAFSSVYGGDSDIPSSCEMKDEPAFKSLQGNLALFRVRASRSPFHLSSKLRVPLT